MCATIDAHSNHAQEVFRRLDSDGDGFLTIDDCFTDEGRCSAVVPPTLAEGDAYVNFPDDDDALAEDEEGEGMVRCMRILDLVFVSRSACCAPLLVCARDQYRCSTYNIRGQSRLCLIRLRKAACSYYTDSY